MYLQLLVVLHLGLGQDHELKGNQEGMKQKLLAALHLMIRDYLFSYQTLPNK